MTEGDWRHKASCLGEDPELFFPIGNTGPALQQIQEAKAVCNRCEVRDTCLAWALDTGQDSGVWGALSEDERRSLKRRASRARAGLASPPKADPVRRSACGTATGYKRHVRSGEKACAECLAAKAQDSATRRASTEEAS